MANGSYGRLGAGEEGLDRTRLRGGEPCAVGRRGRAGLPRGLGLFGATDFDAHRLFPFVLHGVTLSLVALAALGRRGAHVLVVAVGLAALVFVQGLLVVAADGAPVSAGPSVESPVRGFDRTTS